MDANLVERPRLALATAIAIVAAVAIVAALFPNTISIAEIPKRGNTLEDLYGRKFDAVTATEGAKPYQLPDDFPTSITFTLWDFVQVQSSCGSLEADWRLDEGRFDWREQRPIFWHGCGGARQVHGHWLEDFLAARPKWELDGDTLTLTSRFGTMSLLDKGEGSKPSEILGKRFRTAGWEASGEHDKPRFRANTWLPLSFDRDGTLRANLGCESVVVPTEVRTGWFRIAAPLRPVKTTDCSRSMAAQETTWLWDLLDQPVQWQVVDGQSLALKPYEMDQRPLTLSRTFEEEERLTDPDLLAGRTYYGAPNSAFSDNLDGYRGIVFKVDENGDFTATAGCEQPSIHGSFRTGWVEFGDDLKWTLSACHDSEAEQWLADFLAHQPTWYTGQFGELNLWGGRHLLGFAQAKDYAEIYAEPPPSDVGGY